MEKIKFLDKILAEIEAQLTHAYQLKFCPDKGHAIDHIKRMLKIAETIYDPGKINLFLLKVAIWLHNIDRTTAIPASTPEDRQKFIENFLKKLKFSQKEIALIVNAVEKHNQLNDTSDSALLRYLKDCDRLDIGAMGIVRAVIWWQNQNIPISAPEDFLLSKPELTKIENIISLLSGFNYLCEWEGMIRVPKAKALGRKKFAFMKKFRDQIIEELTL